MPAFDGSNPHPIYLGLAFCAAVLFFGTFMGLLLWNNKRKGYSRMEAAPNGPAPDRTKRPQSHETASTYTLPASPIVTQNPQPAAPAGPPVLPFKTVMQYVGERCIHLLIVGETHSGKSTSARAVLAGRIQAGDQIAILDPHGNPTNWGGIRAVGAGRDFAAIESAMAELLAEMTRRYKLLAEDATYQPPALSIFVDEWPAIQTACKKMAAQFITELAQEGRKVGMRLVMLTQSDLVASLGIEGKGDIRSNFTMLLLGGKASARADVSELDWPAALRKGEGVAYPAVTNQMPMYEALLNTIQANIWRPAQQPHRVSKTAPASLLAPDPYPEPDSLWQRFLDGKDLLEPDVGTSTDMVNGAKNAEKTTSEPVPEMAGLADTKAMVLVSYNQPTNNTIRTSTGPDDELSVAIRALVSAGFSRNKVTQLLSIPGNRAAQLTRIKHALGEVPGEEIA